MTSTKSFIATLVLALAAHTGLAETYTVTSAADDGFGSLRSAVRAANERPGEHRIEFAPEMANQRIVLTSGEIVIDGNVTIDGPGAHRLEITAGDASRVLAIHEGIVTVSGLRLTRGKADLGGGILVGSLAERRDRGPFELAVTIDRCEVRFCKAQLGGGIYIAEGAVEIRASTIASNEALGPNGRPGATKGAAGGGGGGAGVGGGIFDGGSRLLLVNSTISGNRAIGGAGGRGYSNGGVGTGTGADGAGPDGGAGGSPGLPGLSGGEFSGGGGGGGNWSRGGAGGLGGFGGGGGGGGGRTGGGTGDPAGESAFAGGRGGRGLSSGAGGGGGGAGLGGGLFTRGRDVTIHCCTIVDNTTAGGVGGGGAFGGHGVQAGQGAGGGVLVRGKATMVEIMNTILAGNGADLGPDGHGAFVSSGGNLVGDAAATNGFGAARDRAGETGETLDPRLGFLRMNGGSTVTHVPATDSPVLDGGVRIDGLETDQRGGRFERVRGDAPDVGAVERDPSHGLKSLKIGLNFARAGKDKIRVQYRLPVADGFDPAGQTVVVDVGGIRIKTVLDARGRARTNIAKIKVKVKRNMATVKASLKRGEFAGSLAEHGLIDAHVRNEIVRVPVEAYVGGSGSDTFAELEYDADPGGRAVAEDD